MLLDDIFSMIKNDSQCELALKICFPLSPDTTLSPSSISKQLYETLDWQLQENPSLISLSAFFGSARCFNLLLAHGANLNKRDNKGISSSFFLRSFSLFFCIN